MPSSNTIVETSLAVRQAVRGVDLALASFVDIKSQITSCRDAGTVAATRVMVEAQSKLYGLPEVMRTLGKKAAEVVARSEEMRLLADKQLADISLKAAGAPVGKAVEAQRKFLEQYVPPSEARKIQRLTGVGSAMIDAYSKKVMSEGHAPTRDQLIQVADLPKEKAREVLRAPSLGAALRDARVEILRPYVPAPPVSKAPVPEQLNSKQRRELAIYIGDLGKALSAAHLALRAAEAVKDVSGIGHAALPLRDLVRLVSSAKDSFALLRA